MNNNNKNDNSTKKQNQAKAICKLGLDVHAASVTVARQVEGLKAQPAQKFALEAFLKWVGKQIEEGYQVISCYEAGPSGYWLHRWLEDKGVTNYVVCPTRLDSRGKGVNTDKTDATELLVRLDRYVAGNQRAFSVVRVPTVEQEQKRALSRQRSQLRSHRLSLAAQGRMLLLGQGYRRSNNWWKEGAWSKSQYELPEWLRQRLDIFQRLIFAVNREVQGLTRQIEALAPEQLPLGMGRLTHEVLEAEMKDWRHFSNRRQVGSYSGLTGGVSGSGEHSSDLSITKAGNRRVSVCAIECAWRMVVWQPDYWLVKKWRGVLLNPKMHARRRKQAIVAFARQLLVDIWKWKTGRATAQSLGWQLS